MARYNTAQQTLSVTAATTFTYAFTGGLITLGGTAGYTVTLVSPVLFPGTTQTFYNATGGNVTLSTPAGNIVGNGFTAATTQIIPNTSVFTIAADGTNYVVINNEGGIENFQQAVTFTSTLTANSTVTMSGTNAAVGISPSGTGTVTISPGSTLTMQPGGNTTLSPSGTATLTLAPVGGALTLGTVGQTTTMNGNISAAASNQTVAFNPAGTGSVTISPTGTGGLTINPTTLGTLNNVTIGGSTRAGGNFTTLQANSTTTLTGALTVNGASVNTDISPTGTGTVTIAPAGTLTLGTVGVAETHRGNIAAQQANQTVTLSPTGTGTVTIAPAGGVTINPANAGVSITPSGTGAITLTSAATGTMNNVTIGGTTRAGGNFTTLDANSTVGLSPSNANVTISPTGTGTVAISPAGALTINPSTASTINNTSIGASTRSTGAFTTLDANSTVGLSPGNANVTISPTGTGSVTINPAAGLTINPSTTGTINNTSIGASTRSTGAFTTLQANSTVNLNNVQINSSSGTITTSTGALTISSAASGVSFSTTVDFGTNQVTNNRTPTGSTDVTNKTYVDTVASNTSAANFYLATV